MREAEAPQALLDFILDSCSLSKVPDLLAYVIKGNYEQEWKDIIEGAFPLIQASAATAEQAAVVGFTNAQRRTYIAKMRLSYSMAMKCETATEEAQVQANSQQHILF